MSIGLACAPTRTCESSMAPARAARRASMRISPHLISQFSMRIVLFSSFDHKEGTKGLFTLCGTCRRPGLSIFQRLVAVLGRCLLERWPATRSGSPTVEKGIRSTVTRMSGAHAQTFGIVLAAFARYACTLWSRASRRNGSPGCAQVSLTSLTRIRIGRISAASLPARQWRCLLPRERL